MNQHCAQCDQPRKPRHDRPGKFFTLCADHYAEYQRQKNRESYARHKEARVKRASDWRRDNPEQYVASYQRYEAKTEVRERKRKYMKLYLRPWRNHLKDVCEICGFCPNDDCQLDIHHLDEDKTNNEPSNLQTVCANCHRDLKHVAPRLKCYL